MTFNYTVLIYIFPIILFGFFNWRLFKIFLRQKTFFSKYFFLGFFILWLFYLITTIICLFFAYSPAALRLAVIEAIALQTLAGIFLAIAIFPLKLSVIILKLEIGFIIVLTLIVEILYWVSPSYPVLEINNFINWNLPLEIGIIRALILFSIFFPTLVIFFKQSKLLEKTAKRKIILFELLVIGVLISTTITLLLKGRPVGEVIQTISFTLLIAPLAFWPQSKNVERSKITKENT
ncbi:MAG: hypothetical protein ABIE43_03255 [Patescibacteria group bacterium]